MSKTIQGNLLSITHGVFAHQVNLMGVMGTLLAKQIKQRYPTVYAQYRLALGCNRLVLGDIQIVQVTSDLWVCNVAGQQYYGRNKEKCYTDYRALESAFARDSMPVIPLLSLSGKAISRSLINQSIQAIVLEKLGGCICC
jgi:hypothetical protein